MNKDSMEKTEDIGVSKFYESLASLSTRNVKGENTADDLARESDDIGIALILTILATLEAYGSVIYCLLS